MCVCVCVQVVCISCIEQWCTHDILHICIKCMIIFVCVYMRVCVCVFLDCEIRNEYTMQFLSVIDVPCSQREHWVMMTSDASFVEAYE